MINFFIGIIRNLLVFFGGIGASQMCFGYLHEIPVPEELEN
ncbi:cyclic lactone autoinducer peptide [Solibacillus isronensis]